MTKVLTIDRKEKECECKLCSPQAVLELWVLCPHNQTKYVEFAKQNANIIIIIVIKVVNSRGIKFEHISSQLASTEKKSNFRFFHFFVHIFVHHIRSRMRLKWQYKAIIYCEYCWMFLFGWFRATRGLPVFWINNHAIHLMASNRLCAVFIDTKAPKFPPIPLWKSAIRFYSIHHLNPSTTSQMLVSFFFIIWIFNSLWFESCVCVKSDMNPVPYMNSTKCWVGRESE